MSAKKVHASKVTETTQATTPAAGAAPAAVAPSTATPAASSLADRVAQALGFVRMAITVLALNAPALTAAERKGMGKLRKGGDKLIPQIGQIAGSWGVQIRTQPTAAMTSASDTAAQLEPLATLLVGFLREVEDTGFQAKSESWGTATALYSVLKRMSRKDPKLQAQLAPITEFFAYRHPVVAETKAATKPTKVSRRKAKVVAQAKEIVATASAEAAPAAPAPAAASSGSTAPAVHTGS